MCSHQRHANMVGLNSVPIPNWLLILKEEKFFTPCLIHDSVKKNEKNIFCLDCCTSICPHCLPLHNPHVLLQIRRYMYNDVLQLGDAQRLLNCSLVQPYTTNRAKVVFLKQRPTSRSLRGSGNLCIICHRCLQDPYIFCSVSCKVQQHLLIITKNTTIKECCSVLQEIDDSQITSDSVLDSPTSTSLCTVSGSTSATISGSVAESLKSTTNYSTAELRKKKRSSVEMVPRIPYSPATELGAVVNRRKGVPHRSPLY
ncbi:hypothetical protein SESBI_17545 [Sesbania bispinosa]|nr:hypothetical protein SESBI_17545 [Sesbania bispinosa]